MDPIPDTLTSMANTCEVCQYLHMLWICIWMCPHHVTPALVGNAFGGYNSGYCPRGKPQHSAVVEAMDPSQNTPASISNTCKMYFIMFICRGCGCACGYVLTTLLLLLLTMVLEDKTFLASGYHLRGKPHHSVVVEAMDPSQMAPTSMSNTCKVYFIIMYTCYGCACGCILTKLPLLALPCFWKIARILGCHPRARGANHNIIVGWLRLWTHPR